MRVGKHCVGKGVVDCEGGEVLWGWGYGEAL